MWFEALASGEAWSLQWFYEADVGEPNALYIWEILRRVVQYDLPMPVVCRDYLFRVAKRICDLNQDVLLTGRKNVIEDHDNRTPREYADARAECLKKAKESLSLATFELAGKHHPFARLKSDQEHRADHNLFRAATTFRNEAPDDQKHLFPTPDEARAAIAKRGVNSDRAMRTRLAKGRRLFPYDGDEDS